MVLEGLRPCGLDISAGPVNKLLTAGRDAFPQEKEELLPAGLQVCRHVGVDDTGARPQGQTGSCTHSGKDRFAYFESTDSKSRLNFLEILCKPHTDYVVNDVAREYGTRPKLPQTLAEALGTTAGLFPDRASWQTHLSRHGVTGERPVRSASAGALLGSLTGHGVSAELVMRSAGAPPFDVLVPASCWLPTERPRARRVPYHEQHRPARAGVRGHLWELSQEWKASPHKPEPSRQAVWEAQCARWCAGGTGLPSVDGVLKERTPSKADGLRVRERPEVPLPNHVSASPLREYVTQRKVSGGTRSAAGRRSRATFASLQQTCRALGVNFGSYLSDRVRRSGVVPRLAELLRRRALEGVGEGAASALA